MENNDFLTQLAAGFQAASPYLALAAILISLVLIVLLFLLITRIQRLKLRLDYLMRSSREETLEDLLRGVVDDNKKVKLQIRNNNAAIAKINENLDTAYRKIGVVKYNAFPGMAGKMSSSVCLLNNENNGLIINSIHGQEGCYTYVKEIMNGKSINPLTNEDEEALKTALQMQV